MDNVSSGLTILGLIILMVLRFLNNLLRAGYFSLGRISLLAFLEKAKEENPRIWGSLDDNVRLQYSTQAFDKFSLMIMLAGLLIMIPQPSIKHLIPFLIYLALADLWLPNIMAAYVPEVLVAKLFPIMRLPFLALLPFTGVMLLAARHSEKMEEEEEEDPEDVKAFLQAGTEEGIIEEKEKLLIHNLINFNDTIVREVMTPRTDMKCIDISMSHEEILQVFKDTKFSRLPVMRGDIDHIMGVLRFKEFFEVMRGGDITHLLTKVMLVPERKNISDLLPEMLKNRIQMVIVIDEFGGTEGLTTLEDLIEEIIGEIHDEHEAPECDEIIDLNDGSFLVDGKVLLEDFCALFSVDLQEGDVDTVGGFIFNREGHIPKEGDCLDLNELSVEIAKADDRRIYKLKVTPRKENVPSL